MRGLAVMRLTKQSSYAIRALMYCALNDPNLSQVSAISKAFGISEAFLFKLIKPLVKNGILATVRGRNGGIRLARPASEITVFESIRLTEDSFALAPCFEEFGDDCPLIGVCNFHDVLQSALQAFFDELNSRTIADLVANDDILKERLFIRF
jgi:Rrf2 family transcriptional regulator, iron-responsive regulator